MGFFDLFNKNKRDKDLEETIRKTFEFMRKSLFSDDSELLRQCIISLADKISVEEPKVLIVIYNLWVFTSNPKNANDITPQSMIECITRKYPEIDSDKARIIARFFMGRKLLSLENGPEEEILDTVLDSMGFAVSLPEYDQIPNGFGCFGITSSNPVPINGILNNETYLKRLTTLKGEDISWERICSIYSIFFHHDIDVYAVHDEKGNKLSDIYLCPYYGKMSDFAPEGYVIDGKYPEKHNFFKYQTPQNDILDTKEYKEKLQNEIGIAGLYIQRYIETQDIPSRNWTWLQTDITEPYFQHLCVEICGNVYSILIELVSEGCHINPCDIERQIKYCKSNGLIPCIFPIDMDNNKPIVDGIHLISTLTREYITLTGSYNDRPLSKWELSNLAVSKVCEKLKEEGCKIKSYTDIIEKEPHVCCINNMGEECYVIVSTSLEGELLYEIDKALEKKHKCRNCYLANVKVNLNFVDNCHREDRPVTRKNVSVKVEAIFSVMDKEQMEEKQVINEVMNRAFKGATNMEFEDYQKKGRENATKEILKEKNEGLLDWKSAKDFLSKNTFCFFNDLNSEKPLLKMEGDEICIIEKGGNDYLPALSWLKNLIHIQSIHLSFIEKKFYYNRDASASSELKDCLIKKVCLITYTLPNQIRDDVYKKISAYSNFISFVKDECCNISERLRKNYKATMVDLYDSHLLTHNISSFSHYSRRALAEVIMRDYYYCVFDNSKYQEKIAELHSNVFDDYEKAIEWERNNNNILLKIVGDEHGFYSELQKVEEDYKGDLYLPDYLHLHRILPMAIEFCNELTSIDMPDSIREIGGGNFFSCKNIVHINLPEKLSEISNRCFVNCTSLKSVLIRGRVRTIGDWCFSSCNNLQNVDVTPNNDYMFKDGVYIYSKDRTKLILIADKQIRQAVISHEIVSIGNSAFHSCEQLEEVIIESPTRFKEIGSEAFKHCLNLKRIEPVVLFPSKVGKSALWGCEKIEQFYFNDKTIHIESGVLSGCRSITNVSIPICAEIIGDMAFSNTGISEIFIPKNVITIYNNAFAQCEKLMNIQVDPENQSYASVDGILYDCDADSLHTFPSGRTGKFVVTNYAPIIGDYAFMGCNLEKVIIEDGVTRIDSFAFVNSKKLKEVRIPNSVKKIGRDLFYECDNLLAVVIDCAYPPEIDTFGFELPPKVVLYVPEGSVEMYRKHPVWGKYPIIDSIGIGDGKTSLQLEYNIHENSLSYVEPNEYGWETIYKECLPKAAIYAVSIIDDYFHSNGINSHKFKWIQRKLREPYFQHLCFSYENKIYSVLIELLDSEYGNLIFKSDILKQLQVCTNNNLIPCIIPLWNDSFSSPLEQIPLIDSQKRQIVYFNKGEDVMIGRWEMEYMAVNYVSERIKEYGGEIIKKSDTPGVCPQIWYTDKDGKISYICLNVFPESERVDGFKLDIKLLQTLVKYNGYYAEVSFTSIYGRSKTLMRSDKRYQIHFGGFIDIEKQAAKSGTIDNKDFKVNKL